MIFKIKPLLQVHQSLLHSQPVYADAKFAYPSLRPRIPKHTSTYIVRTDNPNIISQLRELNIIGKAYPYMYYKLNCCFSIHVECIERKQGSHSDQSYSFKHSCVEHYGSRLK